ncbi:MAG: hypothetical protein H7Z41_12355 [Cytophagales bacterium]|nr:hypothetical protein [Armatimonadota bacterium]
MATLIEGYARRPKRAAEADGLNDILGGIGLLAVAFMWHVQQEFTATLRGPDFQETQAYQQGRLLLVLTVLGLFAVIFLSKWCIRRLRERFVYPRLGYVAPRIAPIVRQKLILVAFSVALTALTATVFKTLAKASGGVPLWPSGSLVMALGIFSGVVYLWYFAAYGFVRHLVVAGISVLAALLLAALSMGDSAAINGFGIISGLALIMGGAVTFARLLRAPLLLEDEAA